MSPDQRKHVQETWKQVAPIADTASAMFYDRLFEIDPDLRQLFAATDMTAQRRKLVEAISGVVGGLDRLDEIVPQVAELGRRHGSYGVTDAHYDTVGAALLWTLEQGLGGAWTPAVKAAWVTAYTTVAGVMRSAAAEDGGGKAPPAKAVH